MSARNTTEQTVRVRFAPSPTGYLHIGNLRAALFNWLFARHHNGTFLIRVEDTDTQRSKQKYTDSILASLSWTGIEADEPIVTQSQRIDEHKKVLNELLAAEKAYRCFCLPEEVIARYKAQGKDELFLKYDEFCRERSDHPEGKPFVIRFALPRDRKEVTFDDCIRGTVSIALDQLEDFIIARSDGRPMYNFVVVIDDAFMKITHVIRGEDHISNTPKQLLLFEACGYVMPQYAHLPLILGPSGDRLSKRDAATSVLEYKHEGYLPDALINYLVRLGWAHGDQEIFSRKELIDYFTLDGVGKKGAIFDVQKLNWVNSMYIKQQAPNQLLDYMIEHVAPELKKELVWDDKKMSAAIGLYQERVNTLKELAQELVLVHQGPKTFEKEALEQWIDVDTKDHLARVTVLLEQQEQWSRDALSTAFKTVAKELSSKLVQLLQPIRIALIGKSSGPGVFELLVLLGQEESIRRVRALRAAIISDKE